MIAIIYMQCITYMTYMYCRCNRLHVIYDAFPETAAFLLLITLHNKKIIEDIHRIIQCHKYNIWN